MKKTLGIILVVISLMAFFGWLISFSQGKTGVEAPGLYLFWLALLGGGIWLINSADSIKKNNE